MMLHVIDRETVSRLEKDAKKKTKGKSKPL